MRDKLFHRERPTEYQIGRFSLEINRGAIGAAQSTFLHTDAGAGDIDSLLMRSLGEKQDASPWAGRADSLFHHTLGGSGHDDQVRAPAVRHRTDGVLKGIFPWIKRLHCT